MARQSLQEVDAAAVAFARWKGLTQENGVDRAAAKQELDRQLALLDDQPELWEGMKELVGQARDEILLQLMDYSLERSQKQVAELIRSLQTEPAPTNALPNEPVQATPPPRETTQTGTPPRPVEPDNEEPEVRKGRKR